MPPDQPTTYRLANPGLGFVQAVVLRLPGGRLLDVQLGVSRVLAPLTWDTPAYRLTLDGDRAELRFDRPENWAHFALTVRAEGGDTPQGALQWVAETPLPELHARLRRQRIAFLGTARDCLKALPASIARLRGLASLFGGAEIHVFENDSVDGTGDWLSQRQAEGQLFAHRQPGLAARMPLRTQRLAHGRNHLLDHVLARGPWDYLCWADLDGLVGERFTDEGFLSCFQLDAVWDAVFPLTAPIYYDIWALREPTLCPGDYLWDGQHRHHAAIGHSAEIQAAVQVLAAGRVKGWLPVQSAFGGFGLYKAEVAAKGRYVGLQGDDEICEHVPYHQALVQAGARLYLNPRCITHIV